MLAPAALACVLFVQEAVSTLDANIFWWRPVLTASSAIRSPHRTDAGIGGRPAADNDTCSPACLSAHTNTCNNTSGGGGGGGFDAA